tara:strand:+ start:261 stop:611 length:351 start_codon:yes stop_codon:yes gene_type:complete
MIVNVVQTCPNIERIIVKTDGSLEKSSVSLSSGVTISKVRYVVPTHNGPNYVNIHIEDGSVLVGVLNVCIEYNKNQNKAILENMVSPEEKQTLSSRGETIPGEPPRKKRGCCGRRR